MTIPCIPDEVGPAVAPARPSDAARLLDVLTRAFADDPANRWLFAGPERYRRGFPRFAHALGGVAVTRGTAWLAADGAGAALWLAPDAGPDEAALEAVLAEHVADAERGDAEAVFEAMAQHRPRRPHWYLALVGVVPERRGRGVGAALLRPILAACDATGAPAYLEATQPRNHSFYARAGFEALGQIRVGRCPPLTPMLRRPRLRP